MHRQQYEWRRRITVSFVVFGILLLTVVLWKDTLMWFRRHDKDAEKRRYLNMDRVLDLPEVKLTKSLTLPIDVGEQNCRMYNCFNVYKCDEQSNNSNKISVYLYPLSKYFDQNGNEISSPISKEFYQIYAAIADSEYYTDDPSAACILIPPIDLLNQDSFSSKDVAYILASLSHWKEGSNHLLFNMRPGNAPEYNTVLDAPHDKALVAGGGFSQWTYRAQYDISIPIFSPVVNKVDLAVSSSKRPFFLISSQINIHSATRSILDELAETNLDVLILDKCHNIPEDVSLQLRRCSKDQARRENYPEVLAKSTFCLILRSARLGQTALSDALKAGCIPVFANDGYVKPFSEVLDWTRASVTIKYDNLSNVVKILKRIQPTEIKRKQDQVKWFWEKYFSSMSSIALTTIRIINDRIFSHKALKYEDWNEPSWIQSVKSPLFLPLIAPKDEGFTTVILAYDRIESLYKVMMGVDKAPSLKKIIVVWNNQKKPPPPKEEWPTVSKPVEIIRTSANKLSNRFFPFKEIETEAILAIDDDIVMLTADEIEFGYQVWREFPDRLVGFPPRLHLWDDNGNLKYESEWKNDISMVLTGVAFYHKYYNHLYWNRMPYGVKDFVDSHMNCEDIAMNFLISNMTGKAPIKVTPRKKFRCPECLTDGSISLDQSHMVKRSTCINEFMKIYGTLPLKTVNFRADPLLYLDDFPARLKAFPDMGSL